MVGTRESKEEKPIISKKQNYYGSNESTGKETGKSHLCAVGYWIGLSIFLTSIQYAVHSDAFSTILVSFATSKKKNIYIQNKTFSICKYVLLRDGRNFEIKQYITYSLNLLNRSYL